MKRRKADRGVSKGSDGMKKPGSQEGPSFLVRKAAVIEPLLHSTREVGKRASEPKPAGLRGKY